MADIVFPGQAGTTLNESNLPANHNLVIYKGDYVELLVTIRDSVGIPVNLVGATPRAVLKSDYSDRLPIEFAATLTEFAGEVLLSLTSSQTATLLPGSYIWDFQVTFSPLRTRTYIAGDVTVYDDVTV